MRPSTRIVHSHAAPDPATGATTPSIHPATTFARDAGYALPGPHLYQRISNSNRDQLESVVADLEGAEQAAAFSSGCAALSAVFQSLSPGDTVVCASDCYSGTREILVDLMAPWGLRTEFVDLWDPASWDRIPDGIRLIWAETPSNPLLRITDLRGLAGVARSKGALLGVDGTFASPWLQLPLDLGADLVLHATTKFLSGHGDLVGGVVSAGPRAADLFARLRRIQVHGGAVPSAWDSWLTLRGVRTLGVRLRAHCENALEISRRLEGHPAVRAVHYPGLASHPGHAVARAQMRNGFGGVLSFQVHGGEEAAAAVCARLDLVLRATSLGSLETLVEHRARIENSGSTPRDLLRLSVGIEDVEDLWDDLKTALDEVAKA